MQNDILKIAQILKKYSMVLVLGFSSSLLAASEDDCDIRLYVSDPDAAGTNVRNGPGGQVAFIIPAAKETFHAIHAIEFKNGWWKIDRVDLEAGTGLSLSDAWIHGSVVRTSTDDGEIVDDGNGVVRMITPIYSQSRYQGRTGKYLMLDGTTEIIGCSRMWLKIKHTHNGSATIGWWSPEDQCPNPLTNCVNGSDGEMVGKDRWGNR